MSAKRAIAVTSLALALTLAACGDDESATTGQQDGSGESGGDVTKITMDQWLAVPLGSTKEQVIDKFGEPEREIEESIFYPALVSAGTYVGLPDAQFYFDSDTGELSSKTWWVEPREDAPITAADYRRVKNGVTEAQVVKILGVPWSRRDQASIYTTAESGAVSPGTVQRCIDYTLPKQENATICFDPTGKVNYMYPPSA